jgi:FtsZ-interacting cell division protein YlmF
MGKWNRFLVWLGFRVLPEEVPEPNPARQGDFFVEGREPSAYGTVIPIGTHRDSRLPGTPSVPGYSSAQADFTGIKMVTPRSYNDACMIGEAYRKGVPVIMTLTEMPDAEAKRLVDFAAGLTFGLGGEFERATTAVFVLSPANIKIGNDSETLLERRVYNQG